MNKKEEEIKKRKEEIEDQILTEKQIKTYEKIIIELFEKDGIKYNNNTLKAFLAAINFTLYATEQKEGKKVITLTIMATEKLVRTKNKNFLNNIQIKKN